MPEEPGEVEDDDDVADEDAAPPVAAGGQRLVRARRRKRAVAEPPAAPVAPEIAVAAPAPPVPVPPAPVVAPVAVPVTPVASIPAAAVDGNPLFAYEETLKVHPGAANAIAVERRTGAPALWMITDRPRTAGELYAAIKRVHGRSPETTYEVTFRDAAGSGSHVLVSMPSTMDEPAPPAAYPQPYAPAAPYAPPAPYAQPYPAPAAPIHPGAPFDASALLALQKQIFDMVQAMQAQRQAAAPVASAAPAAPPVPGLDVGALLAVQKQVFDMVQTVQGAAPQQPASPAPVAPPQPQDPTATLLAMQRQVFDMVQALQRGQPAPAQPAPAAAPADPTSAMLAMQKQVFDMVMQLTRAAQPPQPAPPRYGGPYRSPYRPPHDPSDPYAPAPPYYRPPARPQTAFEQLRDAAGVFRDLRRVEREFGFGAPAAEEGEEDDSPVRVIDMGPAKGVINREDGSLRVTETVMANLPDALKWFGEQAAAVRKARDDRAERDRRAAAPSLPPGYVVVGPDYQPPPGMVAVPVAPIAEQAESPTGPQPQPQPLPEPPEEMPPPLDEHPRWGMP